MFQTLRPASAKLKAGTSCRFTDSQWTVWQRMAGDGTARQFIEPI
jgi:hypothetical protein